MAQVATYTERQFLQDVRAAFADSPDSRTQAATIAMHLRRMLAVPGWPENSGKAGKTNGTYLIHADDELGHPLPGFRILAYVQDPQKPGQAPSPHDHGACFVVYGVAKGSNVQTRWAWKYGEEQADQPTLVETQSILQKPGDAHYFLPGEIHSTQGSTEERTVYVRITSMDLDTVWRHRYNPQTNGSRAFQSMAAPRP